MTVRHHLAALFQLIGFLGLLTCAPGAAWFRFWCDAGERVGRGGKR